MDTYMRTSGSVALRVYASPQVEIANSGMFGQHSRALDIGESLVYTPDNSCGFVNNFVINEAVLPIHVTTTRDDSGVRGWQFVNFTLKNSGITNVQLTVGTSSLPKLLFMNGTLAGTSSSGSHWFWNTGYLEFRQVWGADLPEHAVIPPTPIPASGFSTGNNNPYRIQVFFNGGTVSDVALGGISTGGGRGVITVAPNQQFTLTYSVAPTSWSWFTV
jgi:hypothetical protein